MPNRPIVHQCYYKTMERLKAGWGCFYNKSISYLCTHFILLIATLYERQIPRIPAIEFTGHR